MLKNERVKVKLSPAMLTALRILAERNGLALSTQAMVCLRASLDKTIHSPECQDRLRKSGAYASRNQWLSDRSTDHLVETVYENSQEAP